MYNDELKRLDELFEESPEDVNIEKMISDFLQAQLKGLSSEEKAVKQYEISRGLAYMIIRMRAEVGSLPEETEQRFLNWLLSPRNNKAKEDAMFQIFEESCAECLREYDAQEKEDKLDSLRKLLWKQEETILA